MVTVVTGANGFLGSVLVRELLALDRPVRAIVRSRHSSLDGLNIEVVKADITDYETLPAALDGADSVFHFAAVVALGKHPSKTVAEANIKGAHNVAKAALEVGVQHYVHCSSIQAFNLEDTSSPIDESSPMTGHRYSFYGQTKAIGESMVREVIGEGLPGTIINPTGVIGPGDYAPSRAGKLLLDLASSRLPMLIPGGFDWVDVRDVCRGAIAAEHQGRIGENYILSGYWHSIRELAEFAEVITGTKPPRWDFPMQLARLAGPSLEAIARIIGFDPRFGSDALASLRANSRISRVKAKNHLDYEPRSILTSIHDSYHWFKTHGMLDGPLKYQ